MKKQLKPTNHFFIFCALVTAASVLFGGFFMVNEPQSVMTAKDENGKDFIKWVDFNVSSGALSDCLNYDVGTYGTEKHASWIDLLACLASKNGGSFSHYKTSDLTKITKELEQGTPLSELTKDLKAFPYYQEAYTGVLGGFVGEYEIETADKNGEKIMEKKYGLKAFSPIAKGYSYADYDDFGSSRSYGFKRKQLGHDMMGSVGTPIVAVESGVAECVGWNQYGGWRIGIRSFDKKRYYYYAHLRKDHPYNDMYEGKVVTAGEVIGYLGMTGYSTKENVNNINTPHLHWGMQLIFDESQKDALAEIWIDVYAITKLLERNKSAVVRPEGQKEYQRKYQMFEPNVEIFAKNQRKSENLVAIGTK